MKLLLYLMRKSLQEHDEALFNKTFPIFSYYHIVSLCATVLREPIPDQRYAMELYSIYNRARRDGNNAKVAQTINALKKERLKAEPLIQRALDKFKTTITEETNRPEVWRKDCCGLLSHEWEADD